MYVINHLSISNVLVGTCKAKEDIVTSNNAMTIGFFELKYSINSKTSFGGTSFVNIKKMIRSYKKDL